MQRKPRRVGRKLCFSAARQIGIGRIRILSDLDYRAACVYSLSHRLTAMPAPSRREPLSALAAASKETYNNAHPTQPQRPQYSLKRTDAATLQRVSSAESGNSEKPSATGAAPGAAASPTCPGEQGGTGGKRQLSLPPGGFAPLSTRESGFRVTL